MWAGKVWQLCCAQAKPLAVGEIALELFSFSLRDVFVFACAPAEFPGFLSTEVVLSCRAAQDYTRFRYLEAGTYGFIGFEFRHANFTYEGCE